MKWASAVSEQRTLADALEECTGAAAERLGPGVEPDLALVFASAFYLNEYYQVSEVLRRRFPRATLVGCSGAGVIGEGREVEDTPGVSLSVASLPQVSISAFHIKAADLPSPDSPPDTWAKLVGVQPAAEPHFVLLVEPFSMRGDELVEGLDYAFPNSVKIGGLASGGFQPSSHALFLDDGVFSDGAVGVGLSGNIVLDTVVAQGCRPVGEPMRVTQADRNLLLAVDGEPPIHHLQNMYERLSPRDRELVQGNLFLGIAMDPLQEEVKAGEFLIRNVVGADSREGTLAIGAMLQEGQLVQFHVRDAITSAEDLHDRLQDFAAEIRGRSPEGALLFSCTGRGKHLYGRPDHDTDQFREALGTLPLTGFFCNGEIGPVGGATYLHGYTSSFGIFRPREIAD